MAETRHAKVEHDHTKIRNVPIAVTPEGFWCCPTPVGFQKSIKTQNPPNKPKSTPPVQNTSLPKKQTNVTDRKPGTSSSRTVIDANDKKDHSSEAPVLNASLVNEKIHRPKSVSAPRKVTIEFGEPGTSDLKVIVLGKQGFAVKLSVHRSVLMENSSFFANKISEEQLVFPCLEIDDCEDVEIYVETIGLMYGKEMRQRLMKLSVSRVLRILKVAEKLGFTTCIHSCLGYLEAVPWDRGNNNGNGRGGQANIAEAGNMNSDGMHFNAVISEVNLVGGNPKEWWVDTGATRHICANRWMFKTYQAVDGEVCYMGKSTISNVEGKGSVVLKMTSGKELTLNDVLRVPEIRKNLISGAVLNKKGFKLVFESDKVVLSKSGVYLGKGYFVDNLFKMCVMTIVSGKAKAKVNVTEASTSSGGNITEAITSSAEIVAQEANKIAKFS